MASKALGGTSALPNQPYAPFRRNPLYSSSDITSFKSIEDLERHSATLSSALVDIDAQLAEQLKNREATVSAQHQVFEQTLPNYLVPLLSDASRLEKSLLEASTVAEKVSRKVREVDEIRNKAVVSLQRANTVISLKECVEGVATALNLGQYVEAVKHMAVYLSFDRSTPLETETIEYMSKLEQQLLFALRQQLSQAIGSDSIAEMTRLAQLFAPLGLHDEGVSHYATFLEKQINSDLETILNQAQASAKTAQEKGTGEKASFADAILKLTQRAHARVKRAKPILEQAFGASALIHTVHLLQPILTSHMCTLIDEFIKSWDQFAPQNRAILGSNPGAGFLSPSSSQTNLPNANQPANASHSNNGMTNTSASDSLTSSGYLSLASYASSATNIMTSVSTSTSTTASTWNPVLFGPILDQLVIICQTIEVHARFVNAVIAKAEESISNALASFHESTQPPSTPKSNARMRPKRPSENDALAARNQHHSLTDIQKKEFERLDGIKKVINDHAKKLHASIQFGPLSERLMELLSLYTRFEQHYMKRSIEYAIDQESRSNEALHSVIVDDVFFLLKESSNRARATYNANTLSAIVNFMDTELNGSYYDLLEEKSTREAAQLSRAATSTSSHAGLSSDSNSTLLAINQIETTGTYISRLKSELIETCKKIFATMPHELEKVIMCCDEFTRTETKYKGLVQRQLEQIIEAMKPRFLTLFEPVKVVNYSLNAAEYTQYQINDPFAHQLVHGLNETLAPVTSVLTTTNAELFCTLVMRLFVRYFERNVIKKPFTQLGAEQLDRDLRRFLEYFAPNCIKGSARDNFRRITQIAFLLSLGSLEEIQEEWNGRVETQSEAQSSPWSLSAQDAKRIIALRIDFPKEKLALLSLRDPQIKT